MMKNFMTIFLFSICLGALAANKVDVKTFSIFQGKDNGYYIKKKKEMKLRIHTKSCTPATSFRFQRTAPS